MLLAIDIGNTQTSFGAYRRRLTSFPQSSRAISPPRSAAPSQIASDSRQNGPEALWRVSTHAQATPDELAAQLASLFALHGLAFADVSAVCLGSVVPELTRAWIKACVICGLPVPLLPADIAPRDLGLTPEQCAAVGADRLANVVAARARYGAPVIVVDFGTATNLDVIDPAGHFIGGPISAGLELSAAALFARAARLTAVELAAPERIVAQTTEDALRVGLVVGEAAKVDGLAMRIADEMTGDGDYSPENPSSLAKLGEGILPVIATGGLAELVAPHSNTITFCDPTLTLDGLYLMATQAL